MHHEEIDHHSAEHGPIAELRRDIEPFLVDLHEVLHDGYALPAGKQWTVEMGSTCGFKARMILQVDSLGNCLGEPLEETNGRG